MVCNTDIGHGQAGGMGYLWIKVKLQIGADVVGDPASVKQCGPVVNYIIVGRRRAGFILIIGSRGHALLGVGIR